MLILCSSIRLDSKVAFTINCRAFLGMPHVPLLAVPSLAVLSYGIIYGITGE